MFVVFRNIILCDRNIERYMYVRNMFLKPYVIVGIGFGQVLYGRTGKYGLWKGLSLIMQYLIDTFYKSINNFIVKNYGFSLITSMPDVKCCHLLPSLQSHNQRLSNIIC